MTTADKVLIPSLKVWRGHRCGLFVEGVAVDTDGREAALEPEARANKLPAADCAAMEQMRLNQAKQTWDSRHTFCEGAIQCKELSPIRLHSSLLHSLPVTKFFLDFVQELMEVEGVKDQHSQMC